MTADACPHCGAATQPGASFCEECGTRLADDGAVPEPGVPPSGPSPSAGESDGPVTAEPCLVCQGRVAEDGYCEVCGTPAPVPGPARDHWSEEPADGVAGVCDRGIRHRRNEDAMALAVTADAVLLVVCDGVSSSRDSDVASLAAATAARDVLAAGAGPAADWPALLWAAADAAQQEAARTAGPQDAPTVASGMTYSAAPSCTFVAGVLTGRRIVVGCVGDSRAYWVPDALDGQGPPVQLTVDDSWAAEQIALGMPAEEAENSPRGHAITRWLGADSPGNDPHPSTLDLGREPGAAGWLMVISDGLWNYCSSADALQALVARLSAGLPSRPGGGAAPLPLADALVAWANEQGGRDNITVTLARIDAVAQDVEH